MEGVGNQAFLFIDNPEFSQNNLKDTVCPV